jgi:hypothetical protein
MQHYKQDLGYDDAQIVQPGMNATTESGAERYFGQAVRPVIRTYFSCPGCIPSDPSAPERSPISDRRSGVKRSAVHVRRSTSAAVFGRRAGFFDGFVRRGKVHDRPGPLRRSVGIFLRFAVWSTVRSRSGGHSRLSHPTRGVGVPRNDSRESFAKSRSGFLAGRRRGRSDGGIHRR